MPFFCLGQKLVAQALITCFHLPDVSRREAEALKYFCSMVLTNVIYPENACSYLMEGFLRMYFLEDKIASSPVPLSQAFVDQIRL